MGCKRIEIDVQKAAGLAQRGLTDEKIARSLGISPKTFQRRKGEKSELSAALEKARADVEASLGDRILKLAKSDDAPARVQLEACKYFLTMRCGWTQNQMERKLEAENAVSQIPSIEVQVVDYRLGDKPMTMEESARKIEELKAKGVLDDEGRPRPEAFRRDVEDAGGQEADA